jgi:hypothetical protein
MASFIDVVYEDQDRQVLWRGVEMTDCDEFDAFMTENVASRLYDKEENTEFEMYLKGVSNAGFMRENLDVALATEAEESDGWVVGEAIAEAFLAHQHGIVWPWNMKRDKRNPKASLAGADLVGFRVEGVEVQFAFGEVKSSSESRQPPQVMRGSDGMTNQIKNLSEDPSESSLIWTLIKWLFSRCRTASHKELFYSALKSFNDSKGKAISLYGVLIRDTQPNEKDLKNSGRKLAEVIEPSTICYLFAVYIPCAIADLPYRVAGGTA